MVKRSDGVYLLIGKDAFLKKEFIDGLRSSFFAKTSGFNPNFQEFQSKNDSLGPVADFIQTAPFLNEKRLAVLYGVDKLSEEGQETLMGLVDRLLPTSALVLISEETNAKKDPFLRALSEKAQLVACHPPFEKDLPSWITNRARKLGKEIERTAALLLIERAGKELAFLDSALQSLSVYVHPKTQIQLNDVESLLGKSVQADVFALSDFLFEKNAGKAIELLEGLWREGARGYEVVGVLAAQFDRLTKVVSLAREGRSMEEAGAALRVHLFYFEKLWRQASKISSEQIEKALTALLGCDESIKTGRLNDRLALEFLVMEICSEKAGDVLKRSLLSAR